MHVIGFIHEHQREDRDSFVAILFQNVIEGPLSFLIKKFNIK